MSLNTGGVLPTKAARHAVIVQILADQVVRSQSQLQRILQTQGVGVTQATLSRDLEELGANKAREKDGSVRYTVGSVGADGDLPAPIPGSLSRWCAEFLVKVQVALNQVVLNTPPGAASALAAVIDKEGLPPVVGCIAGDDTILVICTSEASARELYEQLTAISKGASGAGFSGGPPTSGEEFVNPNKN